LLELIDTELMLKVAEARQRDVGRGKIRINDAHMRELGITTGDIVEIRGRRSTGAIVWPAYIDDQGADIVRMDGLLRRNVQITLEDNVRIRSIEVKPAILVALAASKTLTLDYGFETFVKRKLLGFPVSKNDTVLIPILGRSIPFQVYSTNPRGILIITDETKVNVSETPLFGVESEIWGLPIEKLIFEGIETLICANPTAGIELIQEFCQNENFWILIRSKQFTHLLKIILSLNPTFASEIVFRFRDQIINHLQTIEDLEESIQLIKIVIEIDKNLGIELGQGLQKKLQEKIETTEYLPDMISLFNLVFIIKDDINDELGDRFIKSLQKKLFMKVHEIENIRELIWVIKKIGNIDTQLSSELAPVLRDKLRSEITVLDKRSQTQPNM
jgi:hypothetical protein